MEVEDKIQFADVAKVAIQNLDKVVDSLKVNQLIVLIVDEEDEVEGGITLVHNLAILPRNKVALLASTFQDLFTDLTLNILLLLLVIRMVPLGQADLALSADQKKELDHDQALRE